jgi:hypothetical protein
MWGMTCGALPVCRGIIYEQENTKVYHMISNKYPSHTGPFAFVSRNARIAVLPILRFLTSSMFISISRLSEGPITSMT